MEKERSGHPDYVERGKSDLAELSAKSATLSDWQSRSALLRRAISRGLGLDPLPDRCALNPKRRGPRRLSSGANAYIVECFRIEILPGLFAVGNLYRPDVAGDALSPAVLLPHGHDRHGRFHENQQHLAGTLARAGCTVLTYDMQGYGEATQIDHQWPWMAALQTWQSIRVLDFLLTLPGVDAERVLCSGYSGGGTQTILLTALDPRVTMVIPVLMVSSAFYGGCVCESGMPIHRLRVGDSECETNNAEIAALASVGPGVPRPMLLVSADADWTALTPAREYPFIRRIYGLRGGGHDLVDNVHLSDLGHDYGPAKRRAAYRFVGKHWRLPKLCGEGGLIDERANEILLRSALSFYDDTSGRSPPPVDGTSIAEAHFRLP